MINNMDCVNSFNESSNNLLKYIISICPKNEKILKANFIKYQCAFSTTLKLNKLKLIEQYIINVLQYKDRIYNRDADFFRDTEDLNSDSIQYIKSMCKLMLYVDENVQKKIFDEICVMTYHAEKYFSQKYATK